MHKNLEDILEFLQQFPEGNNLMINVCSPKLKDYSEV